jgi:hypothetical protein
LEILEIDGRFTEGCVVLYIFCDQLVEQEENIIMLFKELVDKGKQQIEQPTHCHVH